MAIRDDFTAGEVLAAADLNDTFASKVDYALPVNAQTGTTYTFVAADAEKLTTASNAAAVTLTIPPQSSVTWSDNTVLRVVNYGAGAVTIDGGSGVTVTNTSSTIAQYGAAVAIRTGSDAWTVVPFGGGDIPAAEVSSPAATGQYTDTGITYDYYTFTASGTLTVDTAGFADVLIVGGGGAGSGANHPNGTGGGGAGGHVYATDVYLSAGSHTVTVGAGGANNGVEGYGAQGTSSSIAAVGLYAFGGGRGAPAAGSGNSTTGGSGGGGSSANGIQPGAPGVPGQGNDGGGVAAGATAGSGGGGASASASQSSGNVGTAGGAGTANSITGSSVTRAGGGGGSCASGGTNGAGGSGGGGAAGANGTAGTANTGGGGGASQDNGTPGAGGSGIVIVRVKV